MKILLSLLGAAALLVAAPAAAQQTARYHEADARFLQHMIAHHRQALEMTALAEGRVQRPDVKLMAERIDASQTYEIGRMERWLRTRGAAVPDAHAHHSSEHAGMPGMLSPEEMAALAAARGEAFDRLFLQSMIKHHEGALVMVAELNGSQGGGQEPELAQLAAEIDSDQRIEIERMRRMLSAPDAGARPR